MAFNNEIEELKAQIKMLEKKLSFLEELEQTKSPVEEAYKDWWGEYPKTVTASNTDDARWFGFQAGYNAAYAEKVAPPEEEEHKTLYQMIRENDWSEFYSNQICDTVKKWIFQYDCDYGTCEDYLEGYIECQTVLEERLR